MGSPRAGIGGGVTPSLRDRAEDRGRGASQSPGPKFPQSRPARAPVGLGPGGRALWRSVASLHELDALQKVQLHEACRLKDRCDRLDALQVGGAKEWGQLAPEDADLPEVRLTVRDPATLANTTATTMKQLLSALRLPDPVSGKRPPRRPPRGTYRPAVLR